jgi:transposase
MLDPARLVFIDETEHQYGAAQGAGLAGRQVDRPRPAWKLGDDHLRGCLASQQTDRTNGVEGAMSGEMFRAYVEQCLVPALNRGDGVVMDNFAAHKVPGVREAIEKAGATLRYLPKYSPDLNPIELPYSKFKDHLRKAAERTVRGLYRTIRAFVPQLGARECANYFRHAGYVSI